MKTMPISEFKAHALEVIDQIAKTREPLVITRRGRPLAEVVAYRGPALKPVPGKLSSCLAFEKDIVSPLGSQIWEAGR